MGPNAQMTFLVGCWVGGPRGAAAHEADLRVWLVH